MFKDEYWHCIAIINDNHPYAILVESEGYDYARYTAVVLKEEIIRKPELHYDSKGATGNIFVILSNAQKILRGKRRINDFNELREKVLHSNSYEEALKCLAEIFVLIDKSK